MIVYCPPARSRPVLIDARRSRAAQATERAVSLASGCRVPDPEVARSDSGPGLGPGVSARSCDRCREWRAGLRGVGTGSHTASQPDSPCRPSRATTTEQRQRRADRHRVPSRSAAWHHHVQRHEPPARRAPLDRIPPRAPAPNCRDGREAHADYSVGVLSSAAATASNSVRAAVRSSTISLAMISGAGRESRSSSESSRSHVMSRLTLSRAISSS